MALYGLYQTLSLFNFKQAFANIEDTRMARTTEEKKKMLRVNEDVERVRRSNISYTCMKCSKTNVSLLCKNDLCSLSLDATRMIWRTLFPLC